MARPKSLALRHVTGHVFTVKPRPGRGRMNNRPEGLGEQPRAEVETVRDGQAGGGRANDAHDAGTWVDDAHGVLGFHRRRLGRLHAADVLARWRSTMGYGHGHGYGYGQLEQEHDG